MYKDHFTKPFPNGESLKDVEKRIANFLNWLYDNYRGKRVALVAHKSPQLAIEVLLLGKTWEQALDTDWRNTKSWQPGWFYEIKSKVSVSEEPQP